MRKITVILVIALIISSVGASCEKVTTTKTVSPASTVVDYPTTTPSYASPAASYLQEIFSVLVPYSDAHNNANTWMIQASSDFTSNNVSLGFSTILQGSTEFVGVINTTRQSLNAITPPSEYSQLQNEFCNALGMLAQGYTTLATCGANHDSAYMPATLQLIQNNDTLIMGYIKIYTDDMTEAGVATIIQSQTPTTTVPPSTNTTPPRTTTASPQIQIPPTPTTTTPPRTTTASSQIQTTPTSPTTSQTGVIFQEDFNNGLAQGFSNDTNNWQVIDGKYTAANEFSFSMFGNTAWTDYSVEGDFDTAEDGGLMVRAQDFNNGVVLIVRPEYGDVYWILRVNGQFTTIYGHVQTSLKPFDTVHVKAAVKGDLYSAYVNGLLVTSADIPGFPNGKAGLYLCQPPNQYWDNIVVCQQSTTTTASSQIQTTPTSPTTSQTGVIFQSDFNNGFAQGFNDDTGNWEVIAGQYTAANAQSFSTFGDSTWTNYSLEADFGSALDGGLMVRAQDFNNGVVLVVRPNDGDMYWQTRVNGQWTTIYGDVKISNAPHNTIHVTAEVIGNEYKGYINGVLITTADIPSFASGKAGVYIYQYAGQSWDNVIVYQK
jgi:hypothetical protein